MTELKTSRWAAQLAGHRHYRGKECPFGHGTLRLSASGRCAECITPKPVKPKLSSRELREQARDRNELFYTANEPCQRGHYERYVGTGECVECAKARRIKWAACHRAEIAEYHRQWYAENKSYVIVSNKARRQKKRESAAHV